MFAHKKTLLSLAVWVKSCHEVCSGSLIWSLVGGGQAAINGWAFDGHNYGGGQTQGQWQPEKSS